MSRPGGTVFPPMSAAGWLLIGLAAMQAAPVRAMERPSDPTASLADPSPSAGHVSSVDAATLDRLSAHPTWQRLLHVERAGEGRWVAPAIVTPAFYLTPSSPRLSPRDELIATLEAFERAASRATPEVPARHDTAAPSPSPSPSPASASASASGAAEAPAAVAEADPRCRFPARLHWLSRQLPNRVGVLSRAECSTMDAWLDVDAVDALSLVHVSGHFANPASAFGHLLLRVESNGPGGVRGLQDLGINFGAVVPPEDGPLVYVLKGLFGGYRAGFTDQSFLAHDAVYSATEQRDMWAYHLELDADQRALLLLHLWELRQARFTYYFLRHNCAWYLSALLELVLEQPLRDARPWQLPSAVFERIDELETTDGRPLVTEVSFVPSLEREFLHGFAGLDAAEARRANALIESGLTAGGSIAGTSNVNRSTAGASSTDRPSTAEPGIAGSSVDAPVDGALAGASSAVLDVLLEWADLGAIGGGDDERALWLGYKRTLLRERLAREPGPVRASLPLAPPPARGPRSLTVAFGAARDAGIDVDGRGADDDAGEASGSATFRFAPYAHDLLDANRSSLRDADFRLGDLSLGIGTGGGVRFRSLDLIAVEKLATPPVAIADRSRRTWRMALRLNGERSDCVNCSSFVVKGGIGLADTTTVASRALVPYAYADVELGSTRSLAGPSLGVLYRPGARLALRLEGRWLAANDGEAARVLRLGAFAGVGDGFGLSLSASDVNGETRAELAVARRF